MLSLLQIDGLGKRYGLLPSQVLGNANTFDLYVMDAVLSWESYQHKKQNSKPGTFVPDLTTEELVEIYNKNNEKKKHVTSKSKRDK